MDEGRVDEMITNRLAEIPIAEEVSVWVNTLLKIQP
jgi:hypothetical protein